MWMFQGIPQGQEWSSEEFQDKERQEGVGIALYNIQTGDWMIGDMRWMVVWTIWSC